MNSMVWKYVKPLKNKGIVETFLEKQKVNLPQNLQQCIIENNGGRPINPFFKTQKGTDYVFQSLFSYNEEDKNGIYPVYFNIFENTDLYPIGIEAAGNIICYHLQEKKYVLWKHEIEAYEEVIF